MKLKSISKLSMMIQIRQLPQSSTESLSSDFLLEVLSLDPVFLILKFTKTKCMGSSLYQVLILDMQVIRVILLDQVYGSWKNLLSRAV